MVAKHLANDYQVDDTLSFLAQARALFLQRICLLKKGSPEKMLQTNTTNLNKLAAKAPKEGNIEQHSIRFAKRSGEL